MDFGVIVNNFEFLFVQGFLGFGGFAGGTLRLAIPAIVFWFWFIIPNLLRISLPEYGIALTAFVVFEAAYLAEIVRAGIQSVARGQVEAANATGLSDRQTMRLIVLPQALRNMIPALVTQFIVLLKDTSLASIIGYIDLTKAAQIVNNREIRPFELYLFIAVIYWSV